MEAHLNWLPREVVDTPSLKMFKVRGSKQPGLVESDPAHGKGLELDHLSGPFQPNLFCDSALG